MVSFFGLDFIDISVGCYSNRLDLLDILGSLLGGVIVVGPLCNAGLNSVKTVLNNIGVILDNIKIGLGNTFIIFLILFFDNIIGFAIIFNLIMVRADLYIGNRIRFTGLLILNLFKILDAENFVKINLV